MPPPGDSAVLDDTAGPLHLLKMAVGAGSVEELRELRAARLQERGASWVYTRNQPRRAAGVLAGGSLYWVVRGQIRARQRITGFRSERDDKGRSYCLIEVDPEVVATQWRAWRPFQGWRYLSVADAPPDLLPDLLKARPDAGLPAEAPMPARLVAELRALGLL